MIGFLIALLSGALMSIQGVFNTQLTVAYLIQLFGLFGMDREPFSWRKAGGLLLAVAGIAVFQWK